MNKKSKKKEQEKKPLKPVFAAANIVYTGIFFAAFALYMIIMPRSTVSEIEQRELAEFPEFTYEDFLNGKYTNGIANYYDDTVPYRDDLKKVGAGIRGMFGVSYNDAVVVGQVEAITTEPDEEPEEEITTPETTTVTTVPVSQGGEDVSEVTTAPPATTTTAETTKSVNEIADGVITNGQVVVKLSDGHYRALSLFGGGKGKTYAQALNRFREQLDEKVNIYSMVVPTAGEYYMPSNFSENNASQQKSIESINSQLNEGILPVDAVTELGKHTAEPIYTRTDHHWQPLGAYYAAKTFAEAAGVPFADISTYERVDVEGYVGTMYAFTNENVNILNDPETFTYYKPSNDYTTYYYDTAYNFDYQLPLFVPMPVSGSYSTFMGGDAKIVRIETDVNNGRKLLIFKDSYGNAEVPFYTGSFEEIYVCDMRYFDLNAVEFIEEHKITDLLFTMCTFSAVGTNSKGLNTVLDNPLMSETEEAAENSAETTESSD